MREAPPPLETHPWYADKPWVWQWVAGKAPEFPKDMLRIPVMPVISTAIFSGTADEPGLKVITMTRHRAWAPAPYVGDPFIYTWWVGKDSLGRYVSSDAEIQYVGDNFEFL